MQIIEISEKDIGLINAFRDNSGIVDFDISDPVLLQLYTFYANGVHKQDCYYVYTGAIPITEIIDVSREFVYNTYGIYRDRQSIKDDRKQLGIIKADWLSDADTFSQEWLLNRIDDFTLGDIIIEKNYGETSIEEKRKDAEIINSMPGIDIKQILNDKFVTYATFKVTEEQLKEIIAAGYNLIDVSPVCNRFQNLNDPDVALNAVKQIKNYILEVNKSNDSCVFYYKDTKDDMNQIFTALAAVLTVTANLHFFIPSDSRPLFFNYMYMLHSRENLYCDEYLDYLNHFPIYSIRLRRHAGYIYQKYLEMIAFDKRKPSTEQKYSIKLKIHYAPVEIEDNKIVRHESFTLNSVQLNYDDLNILSMRDFIGISNLDVERARQRVKIINDFMQLCTLDLYKNTPINNTIFHAGNTIMFKVNGSNQLYIGCVLDISYVLPFIVIPMDSKFKPFACDVPLNTMQGLLDYHIFFDIQNRINDLSRRSQIRSQNIGISVDYTKNSFYSCDPQRYNGFLLKAIKASRCNIRSHILSYEDVAMWSIQTSQFRKDDLGILADVLNPRELLKTGVLNFYGGPHPMDTTEVVIKDCYWRG